MTTEFVVQKIVIENLYDSLIRFSGLEKAVLYDTVSHTRLCKEKINDKDVGIIINDSTVLVFQKKVIWQQTDSLNLLGLQINYEIEDLNGDGFKDLSIKEDIGVHGNRLSNVFLSDRSGYLHYRPDIDKLNIRFNSQTKLIETFYVGAVFDIVYKELYRWQMDSLRFVKGVSFTPPYSLFERPITRFYDSINGKQHITRKMADQEMKIYDIALFKMTY